MLKALIFDVDGTLAETEEIHRRAFNELFDEWGLGWHWDIEKYGQLLKVTGGKERIAAYLDEIGDHWDFACIKELHEAKTARYVSLLDGITLRPGIAELIARAQREGLRIAIATTTSLPNVERLIEAAFDDNPFEVIAAGDQVARKKPASDVYDLALARLGLPADQCLALEDSLNGVNSALGAGLPVVVCKARYTLDEDLSAATCEIDSYETMARAEDLTAFARQTA